MEDSRALAEVIKNFIRRSNQRFYSTVLVFFVCLFALSWSFSFFQATTQKHKQQLYQLERSLSQYRTDLGTTANQAALLKEETHSLAEAVHGLTTQEVMARLAVVEERADSVSEQLSTLQGIITPDTAAQILSAARVREEMLARAEFEERINAAASSTTARLAAVEEDLRNLYYWLLGGLGSILALTIAVIGFAGKHFAQILMLSAREPKGEVDQ